MITAGGQKEMITATKKHIANLTLKRKILSVILINILLFSIAAFVGVQTLTKEYNQTLYALAADSLTYSAKDIAKEMETARQMSTLMIADNSIQLYLSAIKDQNAEYAARMNAYQNLYIVTNSYLNQFKKNYINFIMLQSDAYSLNSYSKIDIPQDVRGKIIERAVEGKGSPVWITDYCYEYGLLLARDIRRIKNLGLDDLGVLMIGIDLNKLMEAASESKFGKLAYLLYDNGNLIYNTMQSNQNLASRMPEILTSDYAVIQLDSKEYFSVKGAIEPLGWDYICLVSYEKIRDSLMANLVLYACIIFVCIFLSATVSTLMINSINKHFKNLNQKIKALASADAPLPDVGYDYTGRTDELGVLHNHFDNMAAQIHNLINVNYKTNLLMKDAQLKALETQINPHFLYNTLESINCRAKTAGETEISLMTKALGDLLRATLTSFKEDFTIAQELQLIHSYITIQQLRFSSRLCYHENIDESLLTISIPKLTIQPLIENGIHHGLEENIDTCHIHLSIKRNENNLTILVKNSGSQFEDDLLSKLETRQIVPRRSGIGLSNIDKRLKLTFGNGYGLDLYNEDDCALARITTPIRE